MVMGSLSAYEEPLSRLSPIGIAPIGFGIIYGRIEPSSAYRAIPDKDRANCHGFYLFPSPGIVPVSPGSSLPVLN